MMRFSVHQGKDQQWYWRAGPSTGGRFTADGSEGYSRRWNAVKAARRFANAILRGKFVTVDDKPHGNVP